MLYPGGIRGMSTTSSKDLIISEIIHLFLLFSVLYLFSLRSRFTSTTHSSSIIHPFISFFIQRGELLTGRDFLCAPGPPTMVSPTYNLSRLKRSLGIIINYMVPMVSLVRTQQKVIHRQTDRQTDRHIEASINYFLVSFLCRRLFLWILIL